MFAQSVTLLKDSANEKEVLLSTGNQYAGPESYFNNNFLNGARWLEAEKGQWNLKVTTWKKTNVVMILIPDKFYSINLFWDNSTNNFQCYYINFQLPYKRTKYGFDTLDLDLDIVVSKDLKWELKDFPDYQKGIELGGIKKDWVIAIENDKNEILEKINNAEYPFDGSKTNLDFELTKNNCIFPTNWDKYTEDD